MIIIKFLSPLLVIATIIFLSSHSIAVGIDPGFNSINIETIFNSGLVHFFNNDLNDEEYQIEGPYVITINNIRKSISIKLNFTASDWQSYQMITENIMLQYRVVSYSEQENWSQWVSLKSLPLIINLNFTGDQNSFPKRAVIYLQLKVPQSIDNLRGVYQGEFSLIVK